MERLHVIFLRHLILGLFVLALPFILLISYGEKSTGDLLHYLLRLTPNIVLWIAAMGFLAWLAIVHAKNRFWDELSKRIWKMDQTSLDLYAERRKPLRLFLQWGRCFRCLAFWYGGFGSILLWVFQIHGWVAIIYWFLVGSSIAAAISALIVLFAYTKHGEDSSEDFLR
ncbi:MAG: hypothetical protein KDK33_06670 [Leptospiraceae bacterium]|nr:hypothetical protein [Leptospiraceae bacterium]